MARNRSTAAPVAKQEQATTSNLVTPPFRGSFVHLAKPRSVLGGDPKFSIVVVLPKDDSAAMDFLAQLEARQDEVAKAKWGDKIPKKLKTTIRDGDTEDRSEWEGCMFFNASASEDYPPKIVDAKLQPIIDVAAECYSGAWYRASLRPFAWGNEFGQGVSVGLVNVQKIRDDEPFSGGGISPEKEFGAWEDD